MVVKEKYPSVNLSELNIRPLIWSIAPLAISYPAQLMLAANDDKRTCIDVKRNLDILSSEGMYAEDNHLLFLKNSDTRVVLDY